MGNEEIKSYFFVLTGYQSELEKNIIEAFEKFKKIHGHESEVTTLTHEDKLFENVRTAFKLRMLPAFALTDEPYNEGNESPFLSFGRRVIRGYAPDRIYHLITDIHYLLRDENPLRMKELDAEVLIRHRFKGVWNEAEDYTINMRTVYRETPCSPVLS